MTLERRLHPRATLRLEASLRHARGAAWERALIQDLSASGVNVRTPVLLELQTEVSLRFRLERGEAADPIDLEVACVVVRSGTAAAVEGFTTFAGLHFLALDPDRFEAIRTWVWHRLHPEG